MSAERIQGQGLTSARVRDQMISELRRLGIRDERILDIMAKVPRHLFMDEAHEWRAYDNRSMPIGHKQTISQPWVVARMTELLTEGSDPQCALEIGTGCGYQTAVLAPFCKKLYSVERIKALHDKAARVLKSLQVRGVRLFHRDGQMGLLDYAPYDAIMVTAAPEHIPEKLIEQLEVGGRLVIPAGPENHQRLWRLTRQRYSVKREALDEVSFVPLLPGVQ